MKILIIGSKGFLGQEFVTYFEGLLVDVWKCDITTEYDEARYFQVEIKNTDYTVIFQEYQFDVCINCSGAALISDSIARPLRDFTLNTINVFSLLDSIRKYSPNCRFINLSSAAVYGDPTHKPMKEDIPPNPISPYGYHKWFSEKVCEEFHRIYKLKTCSLRLFSAFGKGLKKQLFWDVNKNIQAGGVVKLYGDGNESRDFIHARDIAKVVELIIINDTYWGEVVNVGNGKEVSIKEAVETFLACYDKPIKYQFTGEQLKGYPTNWEADITKISKLGYTPSMSLEIGLKEYVRWLKDLDLA